MPKYSIIIPMYMESESDLRRCFDSIKAQTYTDYEVICVDDASPLDTPRLAIEYGFKYLRNDENLNNGGARNNGVRAATGEYLVFVNGDDYITPDALMEIDRVNHGEDMILIGFQSFGTDEFGYIPDGATANISIFGWNGEPLHVVKRQLWLDNNLFELEHVAFADVDWVKRLERVVKTYSYVPKALYMFQTGNSRSLTTRIMRGEVKPYGD